MVATNLRQVLDSCSQELGFSLVGVARAGHADPEGRFRDWLAKGYHADLQYMETRAAEREDPRIFFPEVKSVVVLGMFYRIQDYKPQEETSLTGKISCYAQGRDYHKVLQRKLKQLRERLSSAAPNAKFYTEVDTGPVLEKVWAQRAGLGWVGKNSNLLTRQGSWLFLATLLTDIEFEPSIPTLRNYCGSCERCIESCPTQAIVAPGVVDARRCIAYLTIENRAGIPRELRRGVGTWIFGCDDCQIVCPWQKFHPGSQEVQFQPREGLCAPTLLDILALDEEGFVQRFAGTPVMRAKRRGLRRNVLVALGNTRDIRAIEAIAEILDTDPDPMLRGHAAWALGELGAYWVLEKALQVETNVDVCEEIRMACQTVGGCSQ